MADNVTIPASGSGTATPVIATDDVSGVHYQKVKLDLGGDGATTPVSGSVPINDNSGSITVDGTVAVSGTVTVDEGANAIEVVGDVAHDAAGSGVNPLAVGGYASAAAPSDVSADTDVVRAWHLRNGAQATVITAAGALIGGDATNGLDVDVTRLPALVAGTANIGDVDVLTLPSIPAGNNNIGDVDVVTLPNVTLAAGTNTNEVVGDAAHDAAAAGNPLLEGGYASAAAPSDVSADGDVVRAWRLRNGAAATVITAAGALVGGDATNGLDVDVTRLPALVAGTANIGDVDVLTLPSIPAGNNNIGDVDIASMPNVTLAAGTNTNEVVGDVAQDAAIAGNPVQIGYRASTAVPTAMSADGDVVYPWANRSGAPVVTQAPHVGLNSDPWNQVHEGAQYTTTQTSTVFAAGGASEKVVVTDVQIQAYGTNAGDCIVYFGTGAFARGTNRAIFDGTFKPSSTLAPGYTAKGPFISGTNGDDVMVTTTNNLNVTISIWYYVVT